LLPYFLLDKSESSSYRSRYHNLDISNHSFGNAGMSHIDNNVATKQQMLLEVISSKSDNLKLQSERKKRKRFCRLWMYSPHAASGLGTLPTGYGMISRAIPMSISW